MICFPLGTHCRVHGWPARGHTAGHIAGRPGDTLQGTWLAGPGTRCRAHGWLGWARPGDTLQGTWQAGPGLGTHCRVHGWLGWASVAVCTYMLSFIHPLWSEWLTSKMLFCWLIFGAVWSRWLMVAVCVLPSVRGLAVWPPAKHCERYQLPVRPLSPHHTQIYSSAFK